MRELCNKLPVDEFVEAMSIARLLWMRRNRLVFNGIFSSPSQVLRQARKDIEEFAAASSIVHPVVRSSAGSQAKWSKPLQGELKCNWDAAINTQQKRSGVGVVVRDEDGSTVKIALARQYPGITNPTVTEALGTWQAVVLCSDFGLQHLNLEGDSMLLLFRH